jgi:hypothetical protein
MSVVSPASVPPYTETLSLAADEAVTLSTRLTTIQRTSVEPP